MTCRPSESELEGAGFISRFLASDQRLRDTMRAAGAELAERLRHEAIGLAYARATEFSPAIPRYHLLAAKVALLAHWPDRGALEPFERDIHYYRIFESTQALVDEYECFREAYTGSSSP